MRMEHSALGLCKTDFLKLLQASAMITLETCILDFYFMLYYMLTVLDLS